MEFRLSDYDEIIREVLDSGGEFQLFPRGTSMLPLIREKRDYVILVQCAERAKPKDIIFYQRKNGQYVLHRILKVREDGYVLCGDNQAWLEYGIQDEQIIGKVKYIGRKGKKLSSQSARLRLYERIWCFLPLRKIYFRVAGHRYLKNI